MTDSREDKPRQRIFFDTEFIEDGRTIDLLSIGMVREDGAMFYAENAEADHSKASEWVKANVLPKLAGEPARQSRKAIAAALKDFCGERPEFWAYYADYDWIALCQLYGTMMDLPTGWPKYCRDVKQLCDSAGNPGLPKQDGEHHALADARWTMGAWQMLSARSSCPPAWIPTSERLPEAETPVLILFRGEVRIGELRWERPGYEDTFPAYHFWDDPLNDGQDWDWPEITHWMPMPNASVPESAPTTYGPIEYDVLTLCLRLCLEPADSHSPEVDAVLEHYRPAWEAVAGGMPFDEALALLPQQPGGPAEAASVGETYASAMNVARQDALEEAANIVESVGRKTLALDSMSFYIATGQAAAAIRARKNTAPQVAEKTGADARAASPSASPAAAVPEETVGVPEGAIRAATDNAGSSSCAFPWQIAG